jgi:hypothetical protein
MGRHAANAIAAVFGLLHTLSRRVKAARQLLLLDQESSG